MVGSRSSYVAPGGGGLQDNGEINLSRFSSEPQRDITLSWWDKTRMWQVYHEPTEHRVVVAEIESRRWDIHAKVLGGTGLAIVLGLVLFGHVPLMYALIFLIALGIALYLILRFEQSLNGDDHNVNQITMMDTMVWRTIMMQFEDIQSNTKSAQKKRFKKALDKHQAAYKEQVKVAKKAGEDKPEYVKLDESAYIKPELNKTMDEIYEFIRTQLDDDHRAAAHEKLAQYWLDNPTQRMSMGRGVLDCGCMACLANKQQDTVPEISGVLAAHKRHQLQKEKSGNADVNSRYSFVSKVTEAAGLGMTDLERRRRKGVKAVEAVKAKKRQEQQREQQRAEKKRKQEIQREASEAVRALRSKKKRS